MTSRQAETLAFIKAFMARNGFSPSTEEIGAALGLRSKSAVVRLLEGLQAHGLIFRVPYRSRSIVIMPGIESLGEAFLSAATQVARDLDAGRAPHSDHLRDLLAAWHALPPARREAA